MAKVSTGIVYRKGGMYLYYAARQTHTGEHFDIRWVESLEHATLFYSLPPYPLRHGELEGAEKLYVKESREVTIVEGQGG